MHTRWDTNIRTTKITNWQKFSTD